MESEKRKYIRTNFLAIDLTFFTSLFGIVNKTGSAYDTTLKLYEVSMR